MERRNIYARSKAEGERRLIALWPPRGLPLVIARPGIVLGDGGRCSIGASALARRGRGPAVGSGGNIPPFVLADDVSRTG